jgi:hypothetical protein
VVDIGTYQAAMFLSSGAVSIAFVKENSVSHRKWQIRDFVLSKILTSQ